MISPCWQAGPRAADPRPESRWRAHHRLALAATADATDPGPELCKFRKATMPAHGARAGRGRAGPAPAAARAHAAGRGAAPPPHRHRDRNLAARSLCDLCQACAEAAAAGSAGRCGRPAGARHRFSQRAGTVRARNPGALPDDALHGLLAIADELFAQMEIPHAQRALWRPRFANAARCVPGMGAQPARRDRRPRIWKCAAG